MASHEQAAEPWGGTWKVRWCPPSGRPLHRRFLTIHKKRLLLTEAPRCGHRTAPSSRGPMRKPICPEGQVEEWGDPRRKLRAH